MKVRYRADRLAVALVLAVFGIQLGLFFFSHGLATWLGMLALLPVLLRHGLGFWPALGLSSLATAALYIVMIAGLRHFGRVF